MGICWNSRMCTWLSTAQWLAREISDRKLGESLPSYVKVLSSRVHKESQKGAVFSSVTLCWCDPTRLTLAVRPLVTMWEVEPKYACDETLMSQSHIYLQTSKTILLSHAQYFSQVLLKQHVWLSSSGGQETNRNVQRWQHVTNVCERPDLGNDLPAYSWIQRMLIGSKMHKWKCVIR